MKQLVREFIGGVLGAVAGLALGIAVTAAIVFSEIARNPDSPSAGSSAILIIFTAPAGLMFGGLFGAWGARLWWLQQDEKERLAGYRRRRRDDRQRRDRERSRSAK